MSIYQGEHCLNQLLKHAYNHAIDGEDPITPESIGAAESEHTHDDRYYTETEVDTLLSGKSDTSHNHDDRYYTETEVDNLLGGKSDTSHTHDDRYYTQGDVNSLLSGKSNTSHTHDDRYYTEAEVNNLLSGKSNTSHTHDDRYYTETEVNNLMAGKVSKSGDTMTGKLNIQASNAYVKLVDNDNASGSFYLQSYQGKLQLGQTSTKSLRISSDGTAVANESAVATVGTKQIRNIYSGTSDMTPGSSTLTSGDIYLVYE